MTKLDKAEGNQDQQPIHPSEAAAVVQAVTVEFSSPVPHPQLLRQYNEVVPHGADRIVKLTEEQVQHRQCGGCRRPGRIVLLQGAEVP